MLSIVRGIQVFMAVEPTDLRKGFDGLSAAVQTHYRRLYEIEDQARGKSPEEILSLRRELSAPIMGQIRAWLDRDSTHKALPKSRLGEAVRYLNNQWEALNVFLSDGRVPIDNNDTEQLMKQVATGRNYAKLCITERIGSSSEVSPQVNEL